MEKSTSKTIILDASQKDEVSFPEAMQSFKVVQ